MKVRFFILLIAFLSGACQFVSAQNVPPLERTVTLSFQHERLDVVLSRVSQRAGFTFSYSPDILDGNRVINATFTNKSIRQVLNQLFNGSIRYKERGNYVILMKAVVTDQKTSDKSLILKGYVVNSETGEKLPEVSIYDRKTLAAGISNQFGFFEIRIDKSSVTNDIVFNKKNYNDTIVVVAEGREQFLTVAMVPEIPVFADTISEDLLALEIMEPELPAEAVIEEPVPEKQFKPKEQLKKIKAWLVNMENIKDTLYRDFQVSYVPFAGTNHVLSGNVINDYSFNIIGGYSLGTRKLELGGVFNIDKGDVGMAQLAGAFNVVGGSVSGVQVAGVFNANKGPVQATQAGGVFNFNASGVRGVQMAGVMNGNYGVSQGVQVAGVMNLQIKDYAGSQLAGVMNVATHDITGSQVAGVLNIGRNVRGVQIGLINIADSIRGVPIGFLSLVRRGYHSIEISADEVFYTNLAFRTGARQFYNILTAGIKPDTFSDPYWTMGYGIGTLPRLTPWMYLNADLTANHVSQGHLNKSLSLLNKLYLGFDFRLAKKVSLTAGATLNSYLTRRSEEYPSLFTDYEPSMVVDKDIGSSSHLQMWWGGKIGLRFW